MALFQPTMITPDLVSGAENGVVFVSAAYVDLSWQVNGNSPLVAYRIQFFQNDANSTPGTDTGKVTITPFYPVSSDGTQNRYSVSLPYGSSGSYFSIAEQDANKQGKLIITQWWGSTDAQSVTQRSASVFRVTAQTTASVYGPTYSNGTFKFVASVTLPAYATYGESAVLWHRWQIITDPGYYDGEETVIQDTGKIWGASTYNWTANILPPGWYLGVFSFATSNGETITKYTNTFQALGNVVELDFSGTATVECDRANEAVHIDISDGVIEQSVPGNLENFVYGATGSYPATWHFEGSSKKAEWNLPDVGNETTWGFIWEGYVSNYANVLLRVTMKNGNVVTFGLAQGTQPYYDDPVLNPMVYLPQPDHFLAGSASKLDYVFLATGTTGKWDIATEYQWSSNPGIVTFSNNSTPVKVEILDGLMTTRLYFVFGSNGYDTINSTFIGHAAPVIPDDWGCPVAHLDETGTSSDLLYAPFGTNFADGNAAILLREDAESGEYSVIGYYAVSDFAGNYYDYGALNGHSYNYYLAYQISITVETVMAKLGSAQPCFWDWTLIEAALTNANGVKMYSVANVYFFGKNFSSGSDGNGAAPSVNPTFTPYPLVMKDVTNRHSGTLSSLIGSVTGGTYSDTNALRDAIRALSSTTNILLLRSRRGDLWRIDIAGEIATNIQDSARVQPVTASVPWVETGPVLGPVIK